MHQRHCKVEAEVEKQGENVKQTGLWWNAKEI